MIAVGRVQNPQRIEALEVDTGRCLGEAAMAKIVKAMMASKVVSFEAQTQETGDVQIRGMPNQQMPGVCVTREARQTGK
jgi:hypothetical protein